MKPAQSKFSKYFLIIVLSLAILGVIAWMVFVLFENTKQLNAEVKTLEKKYNELNAKTVDEHVLLKDLAEARDELAHYELKFPPVIEQEKTLRVVQELEEESGFKVMSMSYEKLQDDKLNQPVAAEKSKNTSAANSNQPVPGRGMKIPIKTQFIAQYSQLKEFVVKIDEVEQRIGLREIQMNTDKDKNIKGSVILEFYGFMPELEAEESK